MDCDFDAELKCKQCGYQARRAGARRTCTAYGPHPEPEPSDPWGAGVGAELHQLLDQLGIPPTGECGCVAMARELNEWGPDGCRERRAEIVQRLRDRRKLESWHVLAAAAARSLTTAVGWTIDILDPIGSLLDMAIRNAETPPGQAAR